MLLGEFRHNVDTKGRFFFPAVLKDEIGDKPIICRGIENNLMVYSYTEWENFSAKIKSLPFTEAKKMTQFFIAKAAYCSIDTQGRMVIPQFMREFAHINKNIVITGAGDSVEIWDEAAWDEKMSRLSGDDIISIMERNAF